jgi:hypothetical protein
MRAPGILPLSLLVASLCCCCPNSLQAQEDGGVSVTDGGGSGILESIYVPNFPNAPFILTLHTEWVQGMQNGGTFTEVNQRPIMRDTAGRIYQERWILVPKGTDIVSKMTTIQIDDVVAHVFYQCHVQQKTCELFSAHAVVAHYDPSQLKSGPLRNGKGTFLHEDLGAGTFAGVAVHGYRDTTTMDAGTLGNDLPMSRVHEFRYSAELGFNLFSIFDAPQVGRQIFTVENLSTTEPDSRFFQPPAGYKIVDKRKPPIPNP